MLKTGDSYVFDFAFTPVIFQSQKSTFTSDNYWYQTQNSVNLQFWIKLRFTKPHCSAMKQSKILNKQKLKKIRHSKGFTRHCTALFFQALSCRHPQVRKSCFSNSLSLTQSLSMTKQRSTRRRSQGRVTDGGEADSERKNLVLLLAPLDSRLACESQ